MPTRRHAKKHPFNRLRRMGEENAMSENEEHQEIKRWFFLLYVMLAMTILLIRVPNVFDSIFNQAIFGIAFIYAALNVFARGILNLFLEKGVKK